MEEQCPITLNDDVASTSEGSASSTLTVDTRQEKSGCKELPKEMSGMKIRGKISDDHEVTSYLCRTILLLFVYGESLFMILKCY